jgi:hypothetical protein
VIWEGGNWSTLGAVHYCFASGIMCRDVNGRVTQRAFHTVEVGSGHFGNGY